VCLTHSRRLRLVPETCSEMFRYTIESLFITHAQTKLNTIGNMLQLDQQDDHYYPLNNPWLVRGDSWCRGLVRRPRPKLDTVVPATAATTTTTTTGETS
jgi:hypothetical protein